MLGTICVHFGGLGYLLNDGSNCHSSNQSDVCLNLKKKVGL